MPVSEEPVSTETDQEVRAKQPRQRRGGSAIKWLIALALLGAFAAAVFFLGWLPRHTQTQEINKEATDRSGSVPRLEAVRVKRAPTSSELIIPGTTIPYTEANIYARASGYVTKRLVDIGDHVRQGQLLARIDAPDLDRQVAQAQSNLAQSQAALVQVQAQQQLAALTFDRYKVLVARGVFSRQEGDQQEANFNVARANVNAAQSAIEANRQNLNRLVVLQQFESVTAPFTGVITARNVDVGTLIGAGGSGSTDASSSTTSNSSSLSAAQGNNQGSSGNVASSVSPSTGGAQGGPMFSVASIDRLRVLVSVPEAYTSIIRVGQKARLTFQERPNQNFVGQVTRTSASIDQNTRTLLVEVQLINTQKLVPGMYVSVAFVQVKAQPPLIIPGAAIVVRGGQNSVAVVENNIVHLRPIGIGRDYGDQTEVVSGLKEGDAIVLDVTDEVTDGTRIEPEFGQSKSGGPSAGQGNSQSSQQGTSRSSSQHGSQHNYGDQKLDDQAQTTSAAGKSGGAKAAGSNSSKPSKQ